MNEMVTIPKAEYDQLVAAANDLEDLQAVKEFLADPQEGLPSEYAMRLVDGETPLKVWREFRSLSQNRLAELSGVNRVQIGDIEDRGKTGSVETLRKLADALDIGIDDLV